MKALVIDRIHKEGIELLEKYCAVDVIHNVSAEKLAEICSQYEILIGRATPMTPRIEYPLLEKSGRLKVIGIASVGLDQCDQTYIKERGIRLINLPGVNSVSVAEHAFAMMLAVMRRIPIGYEQMKSGNWNKHGFVSARELRQKTLGIIGFGNIGKAVAEIATGGFKMKVIAYDPFLSDEEFQSNQVQNATLQRLLEESDIVTIHAPLTKNTYHMVGRDELKQMKKDAVILNLGRGGIIEEKALYDVLKSGHLSLAALDVQEEEPCPWSPLFELPNFIATPHIAGLTEDALKRAGISVVKEVLAECGILVDSDMTVR
ncbi:hydroxyacid dehydrogenase [bacterium LRH843]|nr:hydroxyacid dehydrogenase [bacterium LRH843]